MELDKDLVQAINDFTQGAHSGQNPLLLVNILERAAGAYKGLLRNDPSQVFEEDKDILMLLNRINEEALSSFILSYSFFGNEEYLTLIPVSQEVKDLVSGLTDSRLYVYRKALRQYKVGKTEFLINIQNQLLMKI